MLKILSTILMIMLITFTMLNHPMSMGMILMISTLLVSLITGTLTPSYWFSYILFLVMIGGMLILFIYMTSIVSNEKFKFSYKILLIIIPTTMLLLIMMMNMENFVFISFMKNFSMESNYSIIKNLNMMSINKIYNNPNNLITIMMINYLLITLIVVVKLTNIKQGPIRQKN